MEAFWIDAFLNGGALDGCVQNECILNGGVLDTSILCPDDNVA